MSNEINIKEALNSKDLFDAFKAQLKKDLIESGCECDGIELWEANIVFINQMLTTILKNHEKKAGFNIQQLLYRVDVNEKQLSTQLQENKDQEYLSIVSELIIKRILQKVVLKKYFSNNGH